MDTVLEVEHLRFTFDQHWRAIKLDEHAFFQERLMPLQLTGAVDILGLYHDRAVALIEVKDYRGRRIELANADKKCAGDTLHLQVARKAKDSVACIAGAARTTDDSFFRRCADIVGTRHLSVKFVFWLEFEATPIRSSRRNAEKQQHLLARQALARRLDLARNLAWLTHEVHVINRLIHTNVLSGVSVENIGRAGMT